MSSFMPVLRAVLLAVGLLTLRGQLSVAADCNYNDQDDAVDIQHFSEDIDGNGIPDECDRAARGEFIRGDYSGVAGLGDELVAWFAWLFNGSRRPVCFKAADTNDDGRIDLSDNCSLLKYLYGSGSRPPAPFPAWGPDPTADGITCETYVNTRAPRRDSLVLGFESCPETVSGEPGELKAFQVFVTLISSDNASGSGAQAWSISLGAEGLRIVSITTAGTDVDAFSGTSRAIHAAVVNPNLDIGSGPQGEGAVSAVILDLRGLVETLPPEGIATIAVITLEAAIPGEAQEARLFFVDGKQGQGQPVDNIITISETSYVPSLGSCTIGLRPSDGAFLRGDCDGDGQVRGVVTDAVFLLNFNFLGGPRPSCFAACDANADGQVSGVVTDAVHLLSFNFLGGPAPPEPFPGCGLGTEADAALGCETPSDSCGGQGQNP